MTTTLETETGGPPPLPRPAAGPAASAAAVAGPATGPTSLAKIGTIAGLALATLVPSFFVGQLVDEREARQGSVQEEFSRSWGPRQTVNLPVLTVPVRIGDPARLRYVSFAPTKAVVNAALVPQLRQRGLFRASVYEAEVGAQVTYSVPDVARLRDLAGDPSAEPLWADAFVLTSATSVLGAHAEDGVAVRGERTRWAACREVAQIARDCATRPLLVAPVPLAAERQIVTVQADLHLRGTGLLMLGTGARELDASVRAPWADPSFVGTALPTTTDTAGDRFDARWQFLDPIAAGSTVSGTVDLDGRAETNKIGVELLQGTPVYRMITRTTKYGLLLVVLGFATYWFFELLARLRIHPLQYGLLGLSLSLFALLLLSLGEIVGYSAAYAISAALVLGQSVAYTAAVTRRFGPTAVFAGTLGGVFAFIYVLLGLETYSLLVGALALFAVLSALMALTQRAGRLQPA